MCYFPFDIKLITWYQECGCKHGQYENWKKCKQRWTIYALASGAADEDESLQCLMPLHMIGEESLDIFNMFTFSQDEIDKIQPLFKSLISILPQRNILYIY